MLEGVQVDTVMSVMVLFVSSTGNSYVITLDYMKNLKNNVVVFLHEPGADAA